MGVEGVMTLVNLVLGPSDALCAGVCAHGGRDVVKPTSLRMGIILWADVRDETTHPYKTHEIMSQRGKLYPAPGFFRDEFHIYKKSPVPTAHHFVMTNIKCREPTL